MTRDHVQGRIHSTLFLNNVEPWDKESERNIVKGIDISIGNYDLVIVTTRGYSIMDILITWEPEPCDRADLRSREGCSAKTGN